LAAQTDFLERIRFIDSTQLIENKSEPENSGVQARPLLLNSLLATALGCRGGARPRQSDSKALIYALQRTSLVEARTASERTFG
jgi:hypothetical protein